MSVEKPTTWLQTSIGSLCNLINGRAFKPKEWSEAGLPIIRIQNLNNPNAKYNYFDGDLADRHRIENGDLLFAWSGTPGTSFGAHVWKGETAALNQHIFKIEFIEALIDKRFLRYAINQTLDELISGAHGGVGLRHVTKGKFEATEIAFPSLTEQKVIADKLDTLLAQVERTKARLERVPQILKRFRQSVLASAVSGRLTEAWRKDKQLNATEQLQTIRTHYPTKPSKEGLAKFHELPQSWNWALVKEVGDVQLGRQRAPKYHQGTNMRPYLRVANVMEGYIDTRDIMEMEFNEKDYERYRLSEGDILLNEGQSHELVGRPAMFNGEVEGACFTNTLVRFRPRPGVSGHFAYMVFLSYLQSGRFQQIASRTVNISHLGAGRFADMEFPFPTMEEQAEIVRQVDQLFAYADRIERGVNNALARVNNLIQSILAKAFRGELTEQWRNDHPALISGENSAEALLERIKAERETIKPKRQKQKA